MSGVMEKVSSLLHTELTAVESLLKTWSELPDPHLSTLSSYLMLNRGKRIRPILTVLSAHALQIENDHTLSSAALIELIHTAMLLHDDVIDTAEERRGRASFHHVFSNRLAILMGDFLFSQAFQIMSRIHPKAFIEKTSTLCYDVVRGELLQLEQIHPSNWSLPQSIEIIQLKTAKLFALATVAPLLISNANDLWISMMENLGLNFGTTFQLIDDMEDLKESFETPSSIEKVFQTAPTFPILYAYQQMSPSHQQRIIAMWETPSIENAPLLREMIESAEAFEYTKHLARTYQQKALISLEALSNSKYKEALKALILWVVDRGV